MKTFYISFIGLLLNLNLSAQEKKSKTYQQSRSAETGRYVSKTEAKSNPKTTYTVNRKK
ncbi:MAG: hypothetical protein QM535_09480 [Limnohabitans sp.]|nr:hypothetical protein [Limnohabitans sp.]